MAKSDLTVADVDKYLKEKKGGDIGDPELNATRPDIFYGTGVPPIDYALGGSTGEVGGFPSGHISEVYGMEAVGKTSLMYRVIANNQRVHPDKIHLLFDYEHTTDKKYIQACGVEFDRKKFRIFRPRTLEEGIELLVLFLKTGQLGVAVYDSLASMMPTKDLEKRQKDLQAVQVASKAKVMSDILKYLIAELGESTSHVCFINHEIANIVANPYQGGYNPPKVTPGGVALKYYASLRTQLNFKGMVTSEDKTDFFGEAYKGSIGKKIQLHVEKFKFGNPGGKVDYVIRAGEGIDVVTPVIAAAIQRKLVKKEGQSFVVNLEGDYDGVKVRGKDEFREYVKNEEPLLIALAAVLGDYDAAPVEEADVEKSDLMATEVSFE